MFSWYGLSTIWHNILLSCADVTAQVLPGLFNHFPVLEGWDHLAITGTGLWDIQPFYSNHAELLAQLPLLTSASNVDPEDARFQLETPPLIEKHIKLFTESSSAIAAAAALDSRTGVNSTPLDMICDIDASFKALCEDEGHYLRDEDCAELKLGISVWDGIDWWCSKLKPESSVQAFKALFLRGSAVIE